MSLPLGTKLLIIDLIGVMPMPLAIRRNLLLIATSGVKIPYGPSTMTLVPGERLGIFEVKLPTALGVFLNNFPSVHRREKKGASPRIVRGLGNRKRKIAQHVAGIGQDFFR